MRCSSVHLNPAARRSVTWATLIIGFLTVTSSAYTIDSDDISIGNGTAMPPVAWIPTLPERRKRIHVPGHEGEVCYQVTIPELTDPRYDTYCEYVYTECFDPKSEMITYRTRMQRQCGPLPTNPPDREECEGKSWGPDVISDFLSCEAQAESESYNCMQVASCIYGIGLWECGLLPDGDVKDKCYEDVEDQYTESVQACQAAYESALAICEATYPDGHSRQNACLRTAHRLYNMALARCDFIRKDIERQACYDAAAEKYAQQQRQCYLPVRGPLKLLSY